MKWFEHRPNTVVVSKLDGERDLETGHVSAIFASWRDRLPDRSGDVGRASASGRPLTGAFRSWSSSCFRRCCPRPHCHRSRAQPVEARLPTGISTCSGRRAKPCCTGTRRTRRRERPCSPTRTSFVYPAPAALVMVPFALLPFNALGERCTRCSRSPRSRSPSGSSASRDYRCYGIALLSAPFANAQAARGDQPASARRRRTAVAVPGPGVDRSFVRCRPGDAEALPLAAPPLARHSRAGSAPRSIAIGVMAVVTLRVVGRAGIRRPSPTTSTS